MKKNPALIFLLAITTMAQAQNVGIGTTTPSEKLDVNGNVNISGTIKANGTAGANGQVLMTNGTNLNWGSIGSTAGYKHCQMFYTGGGGTWTVPAGVTEIMVEAWGAGGGGNFNMGGTSGSYARIVVPIDTTSVNTIEYIIGAGGATGGANDASSPGGDTYVEGIRAFGGGGVTVTSTDIYTFGSGINYMNTPASIPAFYIPGNRGSVTYAVYGQSNSTTYEATVFWGSGGAPIGLLNSSPHPGPVDYYVNGVLSKSVRTTVPEGKPTIPSSGGADGNSGADGMVIFWWN